jgi:hypothetical protein
VYHCEQIKSINPQLLALKKKEEITKPPFELAPFSNQASKFGHAPFSTQLSHLGHAPLSKPPTFARTRPFQSIKQLGFRHTRA